MHALSMQAPTITSGTGQYKAVCHKCQYVGFEPNCNRCSHCGFPLILEPYESARVGLREIFDRSSVELGVNVKAPPLPGVDPQKRKAQLLADARRKLRAESVSARPETARPVTESPVTSHMVVVTATPVARQAAYAPAPALAQAAAGVYESSVPPRRMRLGMALALISAAVAGVLAAAMTTGF